MTRLQLPTVVIAGVGKAGTTSLFWYLSQHPEICASRVKEIRFFTPLAEGRGRIGALEEYAAPFSHCGHERHRLEASPQYFHGGEPVAQAIEATLDDPRVIVLLRDPVERLWSTFRFMRSRLADLPDGMDFEGYVEACRAVYDRGEPLSAENRLYWTIRGSLYVEYLDVWLATFGDRFRVVMFEDLVSDPHGVVASLCAWLGIDPGAADHLAYTVENRTVPVRSTALQRLALAFNSERIFGSRRRLKGPLRRMYYAVNRRPEPEGMPTQMRQELESFFEPSNAALGRRLRGLGYDDLPEWLTRGDGMPLTRPEHPGRINR